MDVRRWFLAFLLVIVAFFVTPHSTFAAGSPYIPNLHEFKAGLSGSNADQVVGVYATGKFALSVVQQPSGRPEFVSEEPEKLTQFSSARHYGVTGLLAHNSLAGAHFGSLELGNYLTVIYGDGHLTHYKIGVIEMYQALEPADPYSSFIDLADHTKTISAADLFNHVYNHNGRLVLQTCIQAEGNPSWGRLFIIAEPIHMNYSKVFRDSGALLPR